MDQLICSRCEAAYGLDEPRWRCDCGSVLDIEFKPSFDVVSTPFRKPTMWRYREAIPIRDDEHIVTFDEGFTSLLEVDFKGRSVLVKQDHVSPTGSFKDRGASVLVSKARELGISEVVEDSSGNAGSALAAYCARAGIGCTIFVPEAARPVKLAQIAAYGGRIKKIAGDRHAVDAAALEAAKAVYYASHCWNPFFLQGTKTFAYEICEQLGWQAPDTVILPAGNGTLLLGSYLGFKDLMRVGITSRIPRLVGVQAARCAPLYRMFTDNLTEIPETGPVDTVADGMAVTQPVRAGQILDAVKSTGGAFLAVEEDEILASQKLMHRKGLYIESTSAVVTAGVEKYLERTAGLETLVTVLTGHGLKTGTPERDTTP
jgi:threonine synthase